MVAGVGSIDLALLVIDITEGWMPQTEEHLQILIYLKVRHVVVALTKIDLVDNDLLAHITGPTFTHLDQDDVAFRIKAIRNKLKESSMADAVLVPTSVTTDQGLEELKHVLGETLDSIVPQPNIGKPRLYVDRAFSRQGVGTVVTGTLTGGALSVGQRVIVQPGNQMTRIRGIQSFFENVESIGPGTRAALNLHDIEVTLRKTLVGTSKGIQRGDVVTLPGLGRSCYTMDVLLRRSARLDNTPKGARRKVKHLDNVRAHLGSRSHPAHLYFLEKKELNPGDTALAQARFKQPLFAFAGDNFIVRDWPEQFTLGSGVVLDPVAKRKGYRDRARKTFLAKRAEIPDRIHGYVESLLTFQGEVSEASILGQSCFSEEEVAKVITAFIDGGRAIRVGKLIVRVEFFKSLKNVLINAVKNEHHQHPERVGFKLSDIKRINFSGTPSQQLLDEIIDAICKDGFKREKSYLKQSDYCISLPPEITIAANKIKDDLNQNPFEPPSRKQLTSGREGLKALHFLIETGELVDVAKDLVLIKDAYEEMVGRIRKFISKHGPASVSELKQAAGTSRRIMIPLLEHLDKERITIRKGNLRMLK